MLKYVMSSMMVKSIDAIEHGRITFSSRDDRIALLTLLSVVVRIAV